MLKSLKIAENDMMKELIEKHQKIQYILRKRGVSAESKIKAIEKIMFDAKNYEDSGKVFKEIDTFILNAILEDSTQVTNVYRRPEGWMFVFKPVNQKRYYSLFIRDLGDFDLDKYFNRRCIDAYRWFVENKNMRVKKGESKSFTINEQCSAKVDSSTLVIYDDLGNSFEMNKC